VNVFLAPFIETRYRRYLLTGAIVLLTAFLLTEAVLLVTVHASIPSAVLATSIAYTLAQLSVFFAPLAFLAFCDLREPVFCTRPLVKTTVSYILPMLLIQLFYGSLGRAAIPALVHSAYVFAFVVSIWGINTFLRSLGMRHDLRKLAIVLLLLLSIGSVVLANGVVEGAKESRAEVVKVLLISNPCVATSAIYGNDILRGRVLYEKSVIGQYYYFEYPTPWSAFLFCLVIGVVFAGLTGLARSIEPGKPCGTPPPDGARQGPTG
jgi:hypothetical protein